VPAEQAAACRTWTGREVIFGLRPEHLVWSENADSRAIDVTVTLIEPLGTDTLVFFEIAGLEMVARLPPEAVRHPGERVRIRPDLRRMHLFDPASGARI
jgi:multiple sugar transport system ATP-binding protein